MNSYDESDEYDYDDGFDKYDVNPSTARVGGGGVNRPFHSGMGTRAKEAVHEKRTSTNQSSANGKKPKKPKK
jgi:hypothetical protein